MAVVAAPAPTNAVERRKLRRVRRSMGVGIAVSSLSLASRIFLTAVRARVRRRQIHPALQPLRRSRLIKAKLLLSRRRGLSSNALSNQPRSSVSNLAPQKFRHTESARPCSVLVLTVHTVEKRPSCSDHLLLSA